ncbi:MAG: PatB family C-S lyase [Bacteroidaceae bacterium]|nr:PatB family C-S lyase [Bacteroidaceae bacterium]
MLYNFDKHIERTGTDSLKYDVLFNMLGRSDVTPLWVADMDFETPPFVMRAISKRLKQQILGYTMPPGTFYQSIINWMQRRHGVNLKEEEIHFLPGIVPAVHHAICALTDKGDRVLIQPPVYHPFGHIIDINERTRVENPLHVVEGRFEMDFTDLEQKLPGCKMMILCNPHNPGGTVWTPEVLQRVAHLCHKHGVMVLSDEIHSDMTHHAYQYTPFVNTCQEARDITITMNAPSKAFNMPGVVVSYCYCLNPTLRRRLYTFLDQADVALGNIFAYGCLEACYTAEGEDWLNQMLDYVQANIQAVSDFLQSHCPKIKPMHTEASFLVVLDNSAMPFASSEELQHFYLDQAGLYLNQGQTFGKEGAKFMRLNVAMPRAELTAALQKLRKAYAEIGA